MSRQEVNVVNTFCFSVMYKVKQMQIHHDSWGLDKTQVAKLNDHNRKHAAGVSQHKKQVS